MFDNKRFIVDYGTWGPPEHISTQCQPGTLGGGFFIAKIQNGRHCYIRKILNKLQDTDATITITINYPTTDAQITVTNYCEQG